MPQQLETESPHLVWVSGLRGSQPQKWSNLDYGIGGHKKNSVRAVYPLTAAEAELPLDVLARLYPAPDHEVARHAA
jgi:hypothetical protein